MRSDPRDRRRRSRSRRWTPSGRSSGSGRSGPTGGTISCRTRQCWCTTSARSRLCTSSPSHPTISRGCCRTHHLGWPSTGALPLPRWQSMCVRAAAGHATCRRPSCSEHRLHARCAGPREGPRRGPPGWRSSNWLPTRRPAPPAPPCRARSRARRRAPARCCAACVSSAAPCGHGWCPRRRTNPSRPSCQKWGSLCPRRQR
mmetsp:Transcript_110741/g.352789  ORF Transcript_110741/g.352789 Transcript_110741/m.352789 type:complete len:201 (+) Transcript_110741:232-834(+)